MTEMTKSVEQTLKRLKSRGATPVEAIKAIHLECGLSLSDAKRVFSLSPSWRKEAVAGNQLHSEAIAALKQDAPTRE